MYGADRWDGPHGGRPPGPPVMRVNVLSSTSSGALAWCVTTGGRRRVGRAGPVRLALFVSRLPSTTIASKTSKVDVGRGHPVWGAIAERRSVHGSCKPAGP